MKETNALTGVISSLTVIGKCPKTFWLKQFLRSGMNTDAPISTDDWLVRSYCFTLDRILGHGSLIENWSVIDFRMMDLCKF